MRALMLKIVLFLFVVVPTAHADWWKDHNPFRPLTPNWGYGIPRPHGGIELFPMCWGSPQSCRDGSSRQSEQSPRWDPPRPNYPYIVTYRYQCRDTSDPARDRGHCEKTTKDASCQEAAYEQPFYNRSLPDPCKTCEGDDTKFWDGTAEDQTWGVCFGW
jgi:hypothetical protein